MKKMTFALCFCNRGFMPGELIYGAREDMIKAVTDAGYDYIAMDASLTRYGGVETRDEGRLYAKWLKEHEGQYDGVIFSMPIFADENGAITALQDAGVPILMQAYPDEIGKILKGIEDNGEILRAIEMRPLGDCRYSIILNEGRKREIRRMTAAVGSPTLRLKRVKTGSLEMGSLPVGEWRELTSEEVQASLQPGL
mgnify:CR=1 FL=1